MKGLMLDQRGDGRYNVIDEDGTTYNDEPIVGRAAAYAELERLEKKP